VAEGNRILANKSEWRLCFSFESCFQDYLAGVALSVAEDSRKGKNRTAWLAFIGLRVVKLGVRTNSDGVEGTLVLVQPGQAFATLNGGQPSRLVKWNSCDQFVSNPNLLRGFYGGEIAVGNK